MTHSVRMGGERGHQPTDTEDLFDRMYARIIKFAITTNDNNQSALKMKRVSKTFSSDKQPHFNIMLGSHRMLRVAGDES